MARSSHRRSRRTGQRKYKRIFDLVCEGVKTEPEYFNWVSENLDNDAVRLNIISKKPGESSPSALIAVESLLRASERARQKHSSNYDSSRNHLDFRPETCGSTLYRLVDELKEYLST
ncbi:MAG: RloB domain-containing protein [Fastidiosipila sp.]|nr:RloB domain-containing protein [Fastidiosipila sp.]